MKKIAATLLLAGCIAGLYGQEDSVLDNAVTNIVKQLLVFPHEKVYLHTDKPYYITGEKIFFRAFLLDAFSNIPTIDQSRYVYVELINPVDSVVKRLKIRPDEDNLFHGAISLPEELTQGVYKIRAYTQYMRNQGESSFFSKYVRISDPQILSVQTQTDFQFTGDRRINAGLRFIDAKTQKVILPSSVILRFNQEKSFTGRPDKEGWIRFRLNAPSSATKRGLYVELIESSRVFSQYIQIPYPEEDFDVSFYPEGGHLIAGQSSTVAFKALHNNGTPLDIEGEVVDSKGDIVVEFKTFYDGMGDFFINPLPDEHYQAVCRSGDRTLRFDLPEVRTNTFALKTLIRDNKLWVAVNKYDPVSYPELYLLIHSGGKIVYAKAWDTSQEYIPFDALVFPSGINHIVLLTKDLQVVSERLVFLLNNDSGMAAFQTPKDTYRKREQIRAEIQLKDEQELPLKGNFSIAVTNDREVITDTASGILSAILLRSELRGSIENPEYYFQKGNKDAALAADLLMKTHGWTRYAIPEVVRGKLSYPSIPFEESQTISGTVKSGLFSKQAKNFRISLITPNARYFDTTETDEAGYYAFRNLEFQDSVKFVIQALNSWGTGRQSTELFVDEDSFPKIDAAWIEPLFQEENPAFLDYVTKADRHYVYENGMRMINLPEIQVIGSLKNNNKYQSAYYSAPDYSFSTEDIENDGGTDIIDLLSRIPGVVIDGNSIQIRMMSKSSPLVVIDDMPVILEEGESVMDVLLPISLNDVGQLDVIKDGAKLLVFGQSSDGGVIVIYTKKGEARKLPPSYNIKSLMPLGYQAPVEFYSPRYDSRENPVLSKPDFRTTIYWKPNVLTDDEGKAKLDFYTADDPSTYSVIIEGVSDAGRLIHYRGDALIRVE